MFDRDTGGGGALEGFAFQEEAFLCAARGVWVSMSMVYFPRGTLSTNALIQREVSFHKIETPPYFPLQCCVSHERP